jgi:hypothetical protein
MTAAPENPQFYQRTIPLSRDFHSDYTISPSPGGYGFAASAQTVLLATVECFDACREYPVIFAPASTGAIVPLALLGLEDGENLFVNTKGKWLGSYIPAYIRRYPFITTDGIDGPMTVCLDESFDGFNRSNGIPLFESDGPSQKLQEIMVFLKDYFLQMKETESFCATLANAGLFRQIDVQANLVDGRSYALNGMLVVDEQKLIQLPDMDIVRLFRNGMMSLITAHFISLRNMAGLLDRKHKKGDRLNP